MRGAGQEFFSEVSGLDALPGKPKVRYRGCARQSMRYVNRALAKNTTLA
jgi:hypothetical protein